MLQEVTYFQGLKTGLSRDFGPRKAVVRGSVFPYVSGRSKPAIPTAGEKARFRRSPLFLSHCFFASKIRVDPRKSAARNFSLRVPVVKIFWNKMAGHSVSYSEAWKRDPVFCRPDCRKGVDYERLDAAGAD
jgi:hypothetical protein